MSCVQLAEQLRMRVYALDYTGYGGGTLDVDPRAVGAGVADASIAACPPRRGILQNFQFWKFLAGSFSAVSKRNFARKYAFDSIFQALRDLHPFAPLQSQNFRKKSV